MFGTTRNMYFAVFCLYLVLTFDGLNASQPKKGAETSQRRLKKFDSEILRFVEALNRTHGEERMKRTLGSFTASNILGGLGAIVELILSPAIPALRAFLDALGLEPLLCESAGPNGGYRRSGDATGRPEKESTEASTGNQVVSK